MHGALLLSCMLHYVCSVVFLISANWWSTCSLCFFLGIFFLSFMDWAIFFSLAAEWLRFCHGDKLILIITNQFSLHGKCLTWLIFIIHIRWWCVDQQRLAAAAAAGWFDILVGRDVFQCKTCAISKALKPFQFLWKISWWGGYGGEQQL